MQVQRSCTSVTASVTDRTQLSDSASPAGDSYLVSVGTCAPDFYFGSIDKNSNKK